MPKLVIAKDTCFILRGDGQREMASGLANAGWKSYSTDPKSSPMSVDIVGFSDKNSEDSPSSQEQIDFAHFWFEQVQFPPESKSREE